MANGFVPGLLLASKQVYTGAVDPSTKITPLGYLRMLLRRGMITNGNPNLVSASIENQGHIRNVTIKYKQRSTAGKSVTTDDCSIQATPGYLEATIPSLLFRKNGTFISYDEIRKYENEASQTVMVGRPAPPMGIMRELWDRVIDKGQGLLQDVDNDLLTAQAAAFGKNVTTGLNTAKTVNFPLSTASNPLAQGMTMLMTDIMDNEIPPTDVDIVGSGLINNVYMQMNLNTQNTKDQNYPNMFPNLYWDWNTTSKWGANQFAVFQRDAVQFININKWGGNFGGDKLSSWLFTLNLPLADSSNNNELSSFKFDAQLRHIDCPQEVEIDGVPTQVDRGWVLDLMANYNQFNIPTDAYNAADRLTGNNGTLRYTATNA
ncbi:hypothetical protein [Segetibacter aerophilus]|uniref:Uncharacterized protein n=1 Tax=Segetibacter aerophilus TaxID=670293 RepID=A0A512B9Y1_9BACT|nr:hypothetical protein [Segetibacter aerophilus]GEO08771.1 hypothetical protein SAE01_12670 [Segetibacter aerophilus]